YRALPIKLQARSSGALGWAGDGTMPVKLEGSVGNAQLRFDGSLRGVASLASLNGSFFLSGRSLAAVGDVIGVTLPTTPAFTVRGALDKRDDVWNTRINDARIGKSQLNAALRYDAGSKRRLLEGRVGGSRLLLQDLGPAIGTTQEVDLANPIKKASTARPGRVLPAREFDLPSLRAMDANVLLSFDELDLGTGRLEPLAPMRAHLVLQDAVLTIKDIDARAAAGSLAGVVSLDGRKPVAMWHSDLRWKDVRLEKWLNIKRSDGTPPYISGRLDGQSKLDGEGKSTAQILASLNGTLRARVRDGSVSHLLVEAAGLDIAQALGVLIKGDESLPMSCALTELRVDKGVMKPQVMVVDTRDSTVWVDGAISLVDESLDLRAVTSPKDFSPLSLRTPVLVKGTMAAPAISLAAKPLAGKVLAAGLLSLLNPLAALIPLIDTGTADDAAPGCAALAARAEKHKSSPKS
ncbi:MAG: AsmA family protein, partial [Ideonella sp.]